MTEMNIHVTKRKTDKLTQEQLKELVTYNPSTGTFISKVNRGTVKVGDILRGTQNSQGYVILGIYAINYLAHRLAFLYMNGVIPKTIDHIDNNPSNNAWNNLREATVLQNALNRQIRSDSASGVKGLHYHKVTQCYISYVIHKGKKYSKSFPCRALGKGKAKELAINWLRETREQLHGEFVHHG